MIPSEIAQAHLRIETERYFLRHISLADVTSRYLNWFRNPDSMQFIEAAENTKELQQLRDYVTEKTTRVDTLFLAICDKKTGYHIGNIKFEPIKWKEHYAVLGILIGENDHKGKGVAVEIINRCIEWLRESLKLESLDLGVSRDNARAIKVYKRCGFIVNEVKTKSLGKIDSLVLTRLL